MSRHVFDTRLCSQVWNRASPLNCPIRVHSLASASWAASSASCVSASRYPVSRRTPGAWRSTSVSSARSSPSLARTASTRSDRASYAGWSRTRSRSLQTRLRAFGLREHERSILVMTWEDTLRPEAVCAAASGPVRPSLRLAATRCPTTQELVRGLRRGRRRGVRAADRRARPPGPGVGEPARGRGAVLARASPRARRRAGCRRWRSWSPRPCARRPGRRRAVRWPNDVVVDGRKLAGVLAELRDGQARRRRRREREPRPPASCRPTPASPPTSLRILSGAPVDRAQLLADLLAAIEAATGASSATASRASSATSCAAGG